jgi:hypothetical protein
LTQIRRLILEATPEVEETVKWVKPSNPLGVTTWGHAGIVCTGEVYKAYVKMTLSQRAALEDPTGIFNAGFGGGTSTYARVRQSISAFKALVRGAVAHNVAKQKPKRS